MGPLSLQGHAGGTLNHIRGPMSTSCVLVRRRGSGKVREATSAGCVLVWRRGLERNHPPAYVNKLRPRVA